MCEIILHVPNLRNNTRHIIKVTWLSNRIYAFRRSTCDRKCAALNYVLTRDTVNASEIKYWPTEADRPDAERKRTSHRLSHTELLNSNPAAKKSGRSRVNSGSKSASETEKKMK